MVSRLLELVGARSDLSLASLKDSAAEHWVGTLGVSDIFEPLLLLRMGNGVLLAIHHLFAELLVIYGC